MNGIAEIRAYFDSCIAIYVVELVEPWSERVDTATSRITDLQIVVSDLVRMESRVLPVRNDNLRLMSDFDGFFAANVPVRLGAETFERATELRASTRMSTPDALHVACAIEAGCDEFWTNDHRLDRLTLPLRVRVFDEPSAKGTMGAPPG